VTFVLMTDIYKSVITVPCPLWIKYWKYWN